MSKTSYILISSPLSDLFFKTLQSGDRFNLSKISVKKTLFSRKSIKGLSQKSLLPQVAELWKNLSDNDKQLWTNAGISRNLNGYRLFVQDTILRIKNSLTGLAEPSALHQSLVGELKLSGSAKEIKICQIHPNFYWVNRKVKGKKGMYEPVKVVENFSLPLKLSLNYKSDLIVAGDFPSALFFAEVWHSYQGRDIFTNVEIPLNYATDWVHAETTLSNVLGQTIGYTLYFWLRDVTGHIFIDNVKAEHNAQNWCRDTYCENINQEFTKAFYQIPSHWGAVILPDGAEYRSVYPT
jgi:hypothetical protein